MRRWKCNACDWVTGWYAPKDDLVAWAREIAAKTHGRGQHGQCEMSLWWVNPLGIERPTRHVLLVW